MNNLKQHKAVYNVPSGEEGGFSRVEVVAPLGMPITELKRSVAEYLRAHPGAMLLSRTWNENDL